MHVYSPSPPSPGPLLPFHSPSFPQEMIYQEPRETLAIALMSLKEAIAELSVAMQNCIRDKRNAELKVCLIKTQHIPCMHMVYKIDMNFNGHALPRSAHNVHHFALRGYQAGRGPLVTCTVSTFRICTAIIMIYQYSYCLLHTHNLSLAFKKAAHFSRNSLLNDT